MTILGQVIKPELAVGRLDTKNASQDAPDVPVSSGDGSQYALVLT